MRIADRMRRAPHECEALVMCALHAANRPLSAHRLVNILAEMGTPFWPNQIYRALNTLREAGKVRRIELLNAYLPHARADDIALVCSRCDGTTLARGSDAVALLLELASICDFRPCSFVIEAEGLCVDCLSLEETSERQAPLAL